MAEIPKAYEPQSVEDKWYEFWLKNGCFTADPARVTDKRPAYSIVIPPPNVTGMLHMGHVLNNTIQDILSRKARMDGKEVLWLPGTDHAGIATQVQVEKALKKQERLTKHDLGREKFLERVWQWKEKHGGIIINQLKKLGCSCDWTRERFTMDPEYSRCVQKVFVELYKKGLIYRGKRMVNWCPVSQTALSDEEVEMKPQKGFMYHFRVEAVEQDGTPVKLANRPLTPALSPGEREKRAPSLAKTETGDSSTASEISGDAQKLSPLPEGEGQGEGKASVSGPVVDSEGRVWLTIATTRPETIPGDTAVAVNPKDPRYAHLIGKHVIRPLPIHLPIEKRLIPIIGDEHVDFEFGTGVLKVTPAHDKADFEIGQRHKLPIVDIMNPNGTMNDLAGESLAGLDRFEARAQAVERLKELGAMIEEKPYENNVGFSQRADVPIEPRLSEQWFLKYPAVAESKACVAEGRMKFHPDRWAKVYDHWLTNIQDWCISRQLWWGHRIPVWTMEFASEEFARESEDLLRGLGDKVVFHRTGKSITAATTHDGTQHFFEMHGWQQDPDVLDTWFSSWLWPFATMGWTGDKSQDSNNPTLQAFYPTTDLVTGPDIIFFWVARMIMAGYEYMGELPFRNVYFTGIIRDKQGRKMSKTLGNSPDPLDLIARYGADALRFGTMRSAPLGQDVLFDEKDVELGRNFCNKLWNACRFRQMQGSAPAPGASEDASSEQYPIQGEIDPKLLTSDDKWILLKLDAAIREISDALNTYNFSTAVQALYRFFWSEYCDWYVEASKAVFFGTDEKRKANTLAVIDFVLSHTIRLFHPFLPFITEELWHGMGYATDMPENQGGKTIMNAPWPKPFDEDFKGHYGLDDCYVEMADAKYEVVTQGRNLRRIGNIQAGKKAKFILKPSSHVTPHDVEVIKILLNAEALDLSADYAAKKGTPTAHTPLGELFLPLEGLVDVAAERMRLTKEVEKIRGEIVKVEQKLANPNFTQKVPPQVLAEHQQRLVDWQEKLAHANAALEGLQG
ncbi:MAG TPA: valine--tRNA ligase [Verrucomicrobiota bacterium]|nr:valine--tRNA ligase [Verrucomicrobiota bacterium]